MRHWKCLHRAKQKKNKTKSIEKVEMLKLPTINPLFNI